MPEPSSSAPRLVTMIGALGVVFGDIGTSPLYALRTMLGEGGSLSRDVVFGLTSSVVWSLLLVVSALYVATLLRTDNEGEGGLLALLALLRRTTTRHRTIAIATVLGMVGASMFLGDCVITPAISVLSAAEGLEVDSPALKVAVLPIAVAILIGVFVLQRVGSGKIGKVYGPVMLVWFAVLVATGVGSVAQTPDVLEALSPHWAVLFFVHDPLTAFLSLGSVILAVTGAEALYADLGHFGRAAISRSWTFIVFPALVVAYLGEAGAVVREGAKASANPFYAVVPGWATIPVLVLATMATVIASEAVIAGAFTVLHQAAGLGLFPYLRTPHTSRKQAGQIYLPAANWALATAVLAVVGIFRSSDRLSSAYGVAVSATFLMTVTLYLLLDRAKHPERALRRLPPVLLLGLMVVFFAATVPKVLSGGWAPVTIGAVLFVVMTSWWSGQRQLGRARAEEDSTPQDVIAAATGGDRPARISGSAVFLTADRRLAPIALQSVVDAGYPLAEHVVLLSWHVEDTPGSPASTAAVSVDTFEGRYDGVLAVDVALGYRERLDITHVLEEACEHEPEALSGVDPEEATYFVSEPIPRLSRHGSMARWRQRVFLVLSRLSTERVEHLRLPRHRTIVIGRELDL